MSTFYKSCKELQSADTIVVNNFMKGFIIIDHNKTHISNQLTKYNLEFIRTLNSINMEFSAILMLERVALRLLEMNTEYTKGERVGLINLMSSQVKTIRYNRMLIGALKKYSVNNQIVYDGLVKNLCRQKDRIKRNRELILELMRDDYGLSSVINLVEKENGIEFTQHIANYTNMHRGRIEGVEIDSNDFKSAYSSMANEYVEYIKQLAYKNNMSLVGDISESLRVRKQLKEQELAINKQKQKDYRDDKRRNIALNSIRTDNSRIQGILNGDSLDLMESENKLHSYLVNAFKSEYGTIYYVALCKKTHVEYLGSNGSLTSGISKIAIFYNVQNATKAIQNLSLSENLTGYTVEIQSLKYTNIHETVLRERAKAKIHKYNKDESKLGMSNSETKKSVINTKDEQYINDWERKLKRSINDRYYYNKYDIKEFIEIVMAELYVNNMNINDTNTIYLYIAKLKTDTDTDTDNTWRLAYMSEAGHREIDLADSLVPDTIFNLKESNETLEYIRKQLGPSYLVSEIEVDMHNTEYISKMISLELLDIKGRSALQSSKSQIAINKKRSIMKSKSEYLYYIAGICNFDNKIVYYDSSNEKDSKVPTLARAELFENFKDAKEAFRNVHFEFKNQCTIKAIRRIRVKIFIKNFKEV